MSDSTYLHKNQQAAKVLYHPSFHNPPVINPRRKLRKSEGIVSLTRYRVSRDFENYLIAQEAERLITTSGHVPAQKESNDSLFDVHFVVDQIQQRLRYLETASLARRLK